MVVKRDDTTEPFERGKLLRGLVVATAKRDVGTERLEALIDDIEAQLHNEFRYEIDSTVLGDMVLERLKDLDKVAYVRFASVYKSFEDVDEFTSELRGLKKR